MVQIYTLSSYIVTGYPCMFHFNIYVYGTIDKQLNHACIISYLGLTDYGLHNLEHYSENIVFANIFRCILIITHPLFCMYNLEMVVPATDTIGLSLTL